VEPCRGSLMWAFTGRKFSRMNSAVF
jgi:hypothetical protein